MARHPLHLLLLFVLLGAASLHKFKVGVFQHVVPERSALGANVSRTSALRFMRTQLQLYELAARNASQQNVSVLVFPEDGLYGVRFTRKSLQPFLEMIADPRTSPNPCTDRKWPANAAVQKELSCMARSNSLYLVANMGDNQPCNAGVDGCPEDGHYQYNTAVAYDPSGKLVARYHKQHLFYEYQFNQPPQVERSTFETPFGKFGLAICFDAMFKSPIVDLVSELDVDHIAFPTLWYDELPTLAAIQFHAAFARAHKVNFLSANGQQAKNGSQTSAHGTGIYAPNGAVVYKRDVIDNFSALYVGEVPINPKNYTEAKPRMNTEKHWNNNRTNQSNESNVFVSKVFHDSFNMKYVDTNTSQHELVNTTTCYGSFCCHLTHSTLLEKTDTTERFALGAFDGLHTFEGQYYWKICIIVKCLNSSQATCGAQATESKTVFDFVHLRGDLPTRNVYPQVTWSGVKIDQHPWSFVNGEIFGEQWSTALLYASLVGRDYEKDKQSMPSATATFISSFVLLVFTNTVTIV